MLQMRSGTIINVSSGVGRKGRATWGPYSVSKFAVEGFTQVLAEEIGPQGLACVAVNPGATRTGMRAAAYPDEDPMTLPSAEDIAEAFLRIAALEPSEVNGKSIDAREIVADLLQKPQTASTAPG
jgi:NAD(P)-dependent dehydrogenase (short-subunit alcohol dehydrogenase family)